jgi:hypothetical protein
VVLDELGPLFLDVDAAGAEPGVGVVGVLLADGPDGLGLDPGLRRVVDAAGRSQWAYTVTFGSRRRASSLIDLLLSCRIMGVGVRHYRCE